MQTNIETKRPRRKLADIRAEKSELAQKLKLALEVLRECIKVCPRALVKTGSYQDVLEFKELLTKGSTLELNGSGSANALKTKLNRVNVLIQRIKEFH